MLEINNAAIKQPEGISFKMAAVAARNNKISETARKHLGSTGTPLPFALSTAFCLVPTTSKMTPIVGFPTLLIKFASVNKFLLLPYSRILTCSSIFKREYWGWAKQRGHLFLFDATHVACLT